jgi:regulator of protease activity HflC (stomatin/prohibitin superfamily)
MSRDWFPILAVAAPVVVAIVKSVRIAREDQRLAVIRLGAFHRVAGPGLVILMPGVEKGTTVDLESIGPGGSWRALSPGDLEARVRAAAGAMGVL